MEFFSPSAVPGRRQRGFTLVELMIVVAIIAILAAVALPSYQSSVRKSRRADAIVTMQRVQQEQERYRSNNSAYSSSLGTGAAQIPVATTSPDGYYTLALSALPAAGGVSAPLATSYRITATPTTKGGQNKDTACSFITLSYDAGTTTYAPTACWSK